MRRAILLFNPAAGNGSPFGQLPVVEAVAIALRSRGLQVEAIATHGPGTAGAQAAAIATDSNVDILFACGGDGTIHDVLQGLVTESGHAPMPALGIIPLGSANALARDLGLPLDPIAAALRQLDYLPRSVPVGKLEFLTAKGPATRYFTVMAGAGPHAALVYPLRAATPLLSKRSLGRTAYYLRSLGLFLTECLPTRRRFPTFLVECGNPASGTSCQIEAVSAIAVRVASLGGLFHPLATGGTLDSPSLRLIVVRPPAQLGLASGSASAGSASATATPSPKHSTSPASAASPARSRRTFRPTASGSAKANSASASSPTHCASSCLLAEHFAPDRL